MGAVLAGMVMAGTVTVPVSATAEEGSTPPETPSATAESTTENDPTESTDPSDPTEPTDPSDSTDPTQPTDPTEPTEPTEPTDPTDPTEPSEPGTTTQPTQPPAGGEPDYVDDVAYGLDIDPERGLGMLMIACAAGEPRGVGSPDLEILAGVHQDEVDGRYWSYLVRLRDGLTFAENSDEISLTWRCGGSPGGGSAPLPVPGGDDAGDWQDRNDGDAQVDVAPKGGVETGFGGTARR